MVMRVLTDFRIERPLWVSSQTQTLEWLASAYAHARHHKFGGTSHTQTMERMQAVVRRFGCTPPRIAHRGHEIRDFLLNDWSQMEVYRLEENPSGVPLDQRMRVYAKAALRAFYALYEAPNHPPPNEILHVTCTGYASPSPAQLFCEAQGWNRETRLSQVYHSGCYAAIPAVRQAVGSALAFEAAGTDRPTVDIVHTEICSLHFDPLRTEPEQIVVHSLFADGNVRYSLRNHVEGQPGFRILATQEEIVPDSGKEMQWHLEPNAFQMRLSRNVPALLAQAVESFTSRMQIGAGIAGENDGVWAVHPGGPRILEVVQDKLKLEDSQLRHSRAVLADCGNMSSATLPHIWESILRDPSVPVGARVPSLAFGPGLTLAGLVLEKV